MERNIEMCKGYVEKGLYVASRIRWANVALTLVLVIGFAYGIINMAKDAQVAVSKWYEAEFESFMENRIAQYEQVEVRVQPGETAWEIQRRLTPNSKSVENELVLASRLNEKGDWGNIKAGESYIFLKDKE